MFQLLRKMKNNMSETTAKCRAQGAFLDNITPDIDGLTDEPVVHQCDVQVVENTFVNDSK